MRVEIHVSFGVAFRARRRVLTITSLLLGITLVASACGSNEDVVETVTITNAAPDAAGQTGGVVVPTAPGQVPADAGSSAPASVEPTAIVGNKVTITSNPKSGTTKLAPTTGVTVTAFNAKIDNLVLVSKTDGAELEGKIASDGSTWTLTDRMEYGTQYTYQGTAVSTTGEESPIKGKLATVKPESTMRAAFQLGEGQTVGVATPIVITFAGQITDKAAAEENFKVTVDGKEFKKGSWAWLQDEDIDGQGQLQSRAHFRPEKYWPAYTDVSVEANLYGVNLGGAWGREDITKNFSIGRKQVVKADVETFRLEVYVDDALVKTYPVSYGAQGADADPERATRNGIHVVQEVYDTFDMCNERFGYCDVKAPWAVRISNNGEFIHVNQQTEASGQLGKANVTHGCVNMGMADGKEFHDSVLYGDPVEVTNSIGPQLSFSDGDIFDWGIPYSQWKTFSAL